MNSRERVIRAIERKDIDRIPIDFGGSCWSIVDSPFQDVHPYASLCQHLGVKDYEEPSSGPLMYEVNNVDERVLEKLGVDIRYVYPNGLPLMFDPQGGAIIGAFGLRMKPVGFYGTPVSHPMRDLNTVEEIENYPYYPDPDASAFNQEGLRERVLKLKENTDFAIGLELGPGGAGVITDLIELLFGMDCWMYNIKKRPALHHAFMNKHLRVTDKILEKILREVGDIVDIVVVASDFGTMQGPFMSRDDYVKHIKPYEASLVERIRRVAPKVKILMHSCGSINPIIQDRAEIGIDVLNSMNPLARNMSSENLKKNFSANMSFHGGIDIQRLLPFGTPDEIKKRIKELIKIWGSDGGWIAAPSHNIQPDTPVENIMAMYDTLQEYGSDF